MSGVEMSCNRFSALYANQKELEFRSCVSGNHDHEFNFPYKIDTEYQIEISQSKENEIVNFNVTINGQIEHSTINTDPSAILLFSKMLNKSGCRPGGCCPEGVLPRGGVALGGCCKDPWLDGVLPRGVLPVQLEFCFS